MALALRQQKNMHGLSAAEHDRIVATVRSELEKGDIKFGTDLKKDWNSHIDLAFEMAKKLPRKEMADIAREEMVNLMQRGYAADARKVMMIFGILLKDAQETAFSVSIRLLQSDKLIVTNLNYAINTWEIFSINTKSLNPKQKAEIKEASKNSIEYAERCGRKDAARQARHLFLASEEAVF